MADRIFTLSSGEDIDLNKIIYVAPTKEVDFSKEGMKYSFIVCFNRHSIQTNWIKDKELISTERAYLIARWKEVVNATSVQNTKE